jgi:hypothetical protein
MRSMVAAKNGTRVLNLHHSWGSGRRISEKLIDRPRGSKLSRRSFGGLSPAFSGTGLLAGMTGTTINQPMCPTTGLARVAPFFRILELWWICVTRSGRCGEAGQAARARCLAGSARPVSKGVSLASASGANIAG